jgi:electron transfer flavoprotein beta subunit
MIIVVLIKQVPDTASVIKIETDRPAVQTKGLKFILNPYDEFAVEEALKIRGVKGGEVIAVSAGGEEIEETIRLALAMGADRALWIKDPFFKKASSRGLALCLAAAVKTLAPELLLAGKQAVDDDEAQVPERVAELLGWPHVSLVTKLELNETGALVNREVEGGYYSIQVPFPAVLTAQKGLNTPRYPTLPNIMTAKKKEIKIVGLKDLGLDETALGSRIQLESLSAPSPDRKNRILTGDNLQRVSELVLALHEKEKVI